MDKEEKKNRVTIYAIALIVSIIFMLILMIFEIENILCLLTNWNIKDCHSEFNLIIIVILYLADMLVIHIIKKWSGN